MCCCYWLDESPKISEIVRESSDEIRFIHDRMPLLLPENLVNEWINPNVDPDRIAKEAVTDVVFERVVK